VSNTCKTTAAVDDVNRCGTWAGEYGCTEMGVGDFEVVLHQKKNGTIIFKEINQYICVMYDEDAQDWEIALDEKLREFGDYLYIKAWVHTKFKAKKGKLYALRGFKKKEMSCR
jgi:hypothetical protein